jgi:phosphoribosyl 1,2-cyclic phosphodiesterase
MIAFNPLWSSSLGNCYVVDDGATKVMLDCGIPWRKTRERLNFQTSDIAGVLLTHSHMDHCKGATDAGKAGLEIYASQDTFDKLVSVPVHRANAIEANKTFSIGSWKVLPFATVHDVPGALAFYMVNQEGEAFLYLTDSAYSPVTFKDLVVCAVECNFDPELLEDSILNGPSPALGRRIRRSHMSLDVLINLLKSNDLSKCRQIFLLHLSARNSDEAKMLAEVQKATGVAVYVCEQ